jgi:hypothetical protein
LTRRGRVTGGRARRQNRNSPNFHETRANERFTMCFDSIEWFFKKITSFNFTGGPTRQAGFDAPRPGDSRATAGLESTGDRRPTLAQPSTITRFASSNVALVLLGFGFLKYFQSFFTSPTAGSAWPDLTRRGRVTGGRARQNRNSPNFFETSKNERFTLCFARIERLFEKMSSFNFTGGRPRRPGLDALRPGDSERGRR